MQGSSLAAEHGHLHSDVHEAEQLCSDIADVWRHCCADLILFTATANTSIVTLNLSLLLNKVGFYQVCCAASHMHNAHVPIR